MAKFRVLKTCQVANHLCLKGDVVDFPSHPVSPDGEKNPHLVPVADAPVAQKLEVPADRKKKALEDTAKAKGLEKGDGGKFSRKDGKDPVKPLKDK